MEESIFVWNFCICNSPPHGVIWPWQCSWLNHGAALHQPKRDLDWICPFVLKSPTWAWEDVWGANVEKPGVSLVCLTILPLGTCYHSSWIFAKFNPQKRFIKLQVQEWPQENSTGPFILVEKCISRVLRSSSGSSEALSPQFHSKNVSDHSKNPAKAKICNIYCFLSPYSPPRKVWCDLV